MIYGHSWSMLKGERIRRWPSQIDEPRPVRVEITTWKGMSIGAKHVNLCVEEEKNMWWSEDDNDWVQLSCDSESDGMSLRAAVYTQEEAEKLAIFFIKTIMKATPKLTIIEEDYHDYLPGIKRGVFGKAKKD